MFLLRVKGNIFSTIMVSFILILVTSFLFLYYYNSCRYFVDRGDLYRKVGRFDKAINWYQKAVKNNNKYIKGYLRLTSAYMEQFKAEEAIKEYKQAIKNNPDNLIFQEGISLAYLEQADYLLTKFVFKYFNSEFNSLNELPKDKKDMETERKILIEELDRYLNEINYLIIQESSFSSLKIIDNFLRNIKGILSLLHIELIDNLPVSLQSQINYKIIEGNKLINQISKEHNGTRRIGLLFNLQYIQGLFYIIQGIYLIPMTPQKEPVRHETQDPQASST